MEDPVQRHPTRGEQLDILATLIADTVGQGQAVLEFGCGVGYVAHLILEKRPDLDIVGVDRKGDALQQAEETLPAGRFTAIEGDLEAIGDIAIPDKTYGAVFTALTFHDLPDPAKRAVIAAAASRLAPGGCFLLYDRLRLADYLDWFPAAGLAPQVLHLHGNVALIGGAKA